jgi:xanthine dehydrogenase/oxidase
MLSVLGDKVPKHIASGALDLQREISSGKQDYDTDSKDWPVNQPLIKVEARSQCSGEFLCH